MQDRAGWAVTTNIALQVKIVLPWGGFNDTVTSSDFIV